MRRLESSSGYVTYALETFEELDLPRLLAFVHRAWAEDYRGEPRFAFDEEFVARLIGDGPWLGVMVCADGDATRAPLGLEVALRRTLMCGAQTFDAYYATLFTVSEHHRRRGIGRRVLQGINRLVFTEAKADLLFSTFHAGHAGSPTVQATFDTIEDWGVHRLHTSPVYSGALRSRPVIPPRPGLRSAPVVLSDDGARLVPADDSALEPPAVPALESAIRSGCSAGFGIDAGYAAHYLRPGHPDRGSVWYEHPDGSRCLAGYWTITVVAGDKRIGRIGQVQAVYAEACDDETLACVLDDLAGRFAASGCRWMSILDTGVFPAPVLRRVGLSPEADRLTFAVRGPRVTIEAFTGARPPFYFDLV